MAEAAGLPRTALRGLRFREITRGVYILSDIPLTFVVRLAAFLLVMPKDAVVSHLSALRLYGFVLGTSVGLEYSTNQHVVTKRKGVVLHRRKGRLTAYEREELPVTGPDRTLIDCATKVSLVQLIQAIEWMIHTGATTLERLWAYAESRHLDGVVRTRRVIPLVRERVESPMETVVRLMLVFARLPEPECNRDIFDAVGNFLARGDMVYFGYKVLIEYDGWQHERDSKQRQHDRERRELLEANGWRVIVVTSEDLKHKEQIPWRAYEALKARGYGGQPPRLNIMWTTWFKM